MTCCAAFSPVFPTWLPWFYLKSQYFYSVTPEKWKILFYSHLGLSFVHWAWFQKSCQSSNTPSTSSLHFFINLFLVKNSYMSLMSSTLCIFHYLLSAWLDRLVQFFLHYYWVLLFLTWKEHVQNQGFSIFFLNNLILGQYLGFWFSSNGVLIPLRHWSARRIFMW